MKLSSGPTSTVFRTSFISAAILFAVQAIAHEDSPPDFHLPAIEHGRGAILAIGDKRPALAKYYGITPQALKDIMLHDLDLWVDRKGNLLYICKGLVVPEDVADAAAIEEAETVSAAAVVSLEQTFQLHSRPGASKKIYLDFDGHITSDTLWNSGYNGDADIISPPYDFDGNTASFSDAELLRIQYIWARVAEDYAPFDVDVTTEDPGTEALKKLGIDDTEYGIRVVITINNFYNTAGGVAYIGSFNWSTDTPCWIFEDALANGHEKYTAEAISHEVGHTLGLYHDGDSTTGYYAGHGNWAPIMGVGYYKSVTQFSKGEYSDANNMEDDLAIISGSFIPYRPDDHGDTDAAASPLSSADGVISGSGIIEQSSDTDVFSVVAGAGEISLTVNTDTLDCTVAAPDYPDCHQPNLDIQADLYDDEGNLIVSSNPVIDLSASINTFVNEGTYYLHITGVGTGDLITGYSDYGSLGKFVISGTVPEPGIDAYPVAAASASPLSGEIPLTVNFSGAGSVDPDGTITDYAWNFGDGGLSTDQNPSNTYSTPGVFTAVLTVTDNDGYTDTASVTITATAPDTTVNTPTDLAVTVNGGTVHLTWTDNAVNEEGVSIERAEKIRGKYTYSLIGQVGANATSFTDSPGLGTFLYRVQAFNSTSETVSDYSNEVSATVADIGSTVITAPSGLSAQVSGNTVSLAWTDNSANEEGFTVERGEIIQLNPVKTKLVWSVAGTVSADDTTFTDTVSSGSYLYRVNAFNSTTTSDFSNEISVAIP